MNVVIVSPEYVTSSNWGGVAVYNYNLAKLLTKLGHRVIVLTRNSAHSTRVYKDRDIEIHEIDFSFKNFLFRFFYFIFPFGPVRWILRRYLFVAFSILEWNLFSCIYWFRKFRRRKIDVIHAPSQHSSTLFISLWTKNIPTFLNVHGLVSDTSKYEPKSIDLILVSFLEGLYLRLMSFSVVACGRNVKDRVLKKFSGLKAEVVYLPNFVDLTEIQVSKREIDVDTLIFVGRLEYRKGPDLLLGSFVRLAKKYHQMKLIFVGSEKKRPWRVDYINFQEWVESLDIDIGIRERIEFVPRIEKRRELIKFLQKHRGIAIVPSRYDPFAYAILEAMATGSLIVASKCGGGGEIIESGKNGFLVNPTVDSICKIIEQVKGMRSLKLLSIASRGRETIVSKYSLSEVQKEYEQFYSRKFVEKDMG